MMLLKLDKSRHALNNILLQKRNFQMNTVVAIVMD